MNILAISGSLRADSFNSKMIASVNNVLPETVTLQTHSIADIPLYDQDVEDQGKPEAVQAFINAIEAADALLISSPEYNYSIPGGLKNAIDWASRPAFESCLKDKPTAVMMVTASGGAGQQAFGHLKQVLEGTMTPVFTDKSFLLGASYKAFDSNGQLADDIHANLTDFISGFISWLSQR